MNKRYIMSQVVKTVFQCLLYVSLFIAFFWLLSINNPQIINMSRTAAITMATFALLLVILTHVYGGYQLGEKKAPSVFASIVITITFTDIVTYLQLQIMNVNPANNSRLILFGEDFWLLLGAMVLQVALIYLFVALGYRFYFAINPPQRCCIVTSSQEQADHIAEKIASFKQRYQLCDVLHYECGDVEQTILDNDVVFLAGIPDTEEAQLKSFCYQNGKTIYLQAELEDVIVSTSQQNVIDDTLFLYIHRTDPTLMQRFVKRTSDIVISLLGLIITSPLMLLATVMIGLSRNGPIFFLQNRATIDGKVFRIIKFRTMYQDACDSAAQSACENDGRITRVGRFLRKFRIDELPQLFNVLNGDMSIVGPRPEMLENVDRYTQEVPEFEYRKQMKAGLTGLAQIDGKYNTSPRDKVILDLLYIENFSLMMDIKLILRTVTIFFRRDSTEGFHTDKFAFCPLMRTEPEKVKPTVRPQTAPNTRDSDESYTRPVAVRTPMQATEPVEFSRENAPNEIVIDASETQDSYKPKNTCENAAAPVQRDAEASCTGETDAHSTAPSGAMLSGAHVVI